MKQLFLLLAAFFVPTAFAQSANEVCFYENGYYGGASKCYSHNNRSTTIDWVGSEWNDKFSSVKVGSNVKVTAFDNSYKAGESWTYTKNTNWVGAANDRISSFEISPVSNIVTINNIFDSVFAIILERRKNEAIAKFGNKTWANYHWLGAHNAHVNTGEAWWAVANQRKSYEDLLNSGVRVLNLDIHDSTSRGNRDVYLCHGSCWGLIGTHYVTSMPTFRGALNRIGAWLRQNPLEVVTITLEDNVDYRVLFDAALRNGNVSDLLFNPNTGVSGGQWPKLSQMVIDNKRLVILSSKSSNADANNGVGYDKTYLTENYWSLGFWGGDTSCSARWDGISLNNAGKAFHMSHFRSVGSMVGAAVDNSYSKLSSRINNECFNASGGRLPNILLLDYPDIGAGMQMVDELNRRNK